MKSIHNFLGRRVTDRKRSSFKNSRHILSNNMSSGLKSSRTPIQLYWFWPTSSNCFCHFATRIWKKCIFRERTSGFHRNSAASRESNMRIFSDCCRHQRMDISEGNETLLPKTANLIEKSYFFILFEHIFVAHTSAHA